MTDQHSIKTAVQFQLTTNGNTNSNVVKVNNVVQNEQGHAVIAGAGSTLKRKETTARSGDNLSWNYNNGSSSWSGAWDY